MLVKIWIKFNFWCKPRDKYVDISAMYYGFLQWTNDSFWNQRVWHIWLTETGAAIVSRKSMTRFWRVTLSNWQTICLVPLDQKFNLIQWWVYFSQTQVQLELYTGTMSGMLCVLLLFIVYILRLYPVTCPWRIQPIRRIRNKCYLQRARSPVQLGGKRYIAYFEFIYTRWKWNKRCFFLFEEKLTVVKPCNKCHSSKIYPITPQDMYAMPNKQEAKWSVDCSLPKRYPW